MSELKIPWSHNALANAIAFADAYNCLRGDQRIYKNVLITNGALAIELFLKAIGGKSVISPFGEQEVIETPHGAILHGRTREASETTKGHTLLKLFERLSPVKRKLVTDYWAERSECGFIEVLKECDNDFIVARYAHEDGAAYKPQNLEHYDLLCQMMIDMFTILGNSDIQNIVDDE